VNTTPRILVIRGGAIGDFILTLPAIGALRERWPDAHIEILGYSHIVELADGRYYAQKTRSIEYAALSGFFVPNGPLDKSLADYFASFNVVVSYLYDPDKIFEFNLRRVGVKLLVVGTPKPTELHAAAHLAKPLEALAIYVESPQPKVFPSAADKDFARQFFGKLTTTLCAVHCGSGSPAKNWPTKDFAAVCRWLRETKQCELVVVCGEADEKVTKELLDALAPSAPRVARGLRLAQLAGVLSQCQLYLGNDSGVTHLAAAVGTPSVVLWGPSSFELWRPLGAHVRVIPFRQATPASVQAEIEKLLAS
jgi:heptosyltransferase-2